jgi:hypothetical protein
MVFTFNSRAVCVSFKECTSLSIEDFAATFVNMPRVFVYFLGFLTLK